MKTLKVAQIYDGYEPETAKGGVPIPRHAYQVDEVTNSVTPTISQRLTAAELNVYCEAEDWEVKIS